MPESRTYKVVHFVASLPGVALSVMWIHHIIELLVLRHHVSFKQFLHPWFLFSATVSFVLFVFHMLVFLVLTFRVRWMSMYIGKYLSPELSTYKEIEMFMMLLDMMWSVLWLLQLVVQLILSSRHRMYPYNAIFVMLGLYVFQIIISVPLCYLCYHKWAKIRFPPNDINKDEEKQKQHVRGPSTIRTLVSRSN